MSIQKRYDVLFKNLKKQREDREAKITIALANVAKNINRKSFRIDITQNISFSKPVYERDNTPESYYAFVKIVSDILAKQANDLRSAITEFLDELRAA